MEVPLLGPDADDVEFYFTPDDLLVQFRAERRSGQADFGGNRRRLEDAAGTGGKIKTALKTKRRTWDFG